MSRLRQGFGAQADVAIIGGGHNGLIAAYYLAKAGLKTVVFERRTEPGGGAVTAEIHPGFRCPVLSHETLLHESIARDMNLERQGLAWLTPAARVCSLSSSGAPLVLHDDAARSAESIGRVSARDAEAYPAYRAAVESIAAVLGDTFDSPPPDIDRPAIGDLWNLLGTGRRFRRLGTRDGYRLLRYVPMPIADLAHEWFETELLRATIAGPGLSGTMLGPRSAGSTLVMLLREAHRLRAGGGSRLVRGGPGALTQALAAAARAAGVEIRTAAGVERIVIREGRAVGVQTGGRTTAAQRVVSAVDPKTTFLSLIEAVDLTPDFALKMRNYRAAGTVAKVNLALSSLPAFGVDAASLGGRLHIGHELDYMERAFDHAKYGELASEPWLDVSIPSIVDDSLAPPGAHVMSVYVHYAPFRLRQGDWPASRAALLEATTRVLERQAPGIRPQIVAAQAITPAELDTEYGFSGGHIFHGELSLDQLFTMRPLLGFARYAGPIAGLFLCGAGTHPGGFLTGASGRLAAQAVLSTRQI
jgi:phytoene dehydrogenase-like protein